MLRVFQDALPGEPLTNITCAGPHVRKQLMLCSMQHMDTCVPPADEVLSYICLGSESAT